MESRSAQVDITRVGGGLEVGRHAVSGVVQEDNEAVEQVEVVAGQGDRRDPTTGYPANVLTGIDQWLCHVVRPSLVVAERFGHDQGSSEHLPCGGSLAKGVAPALQPVEVIRFAGRPSGQMGKLCFGAVRVTHLQMERLA